MDKYGFGRVAVLCGGFSSERTVSLSSGEQVLEALLSKGIEAELFDPAVDPLSKLADGGFSRAFVALHGFFGEDGTVQGLLEYLQIPYTGSGVKASACSMDKEITRTLWAAAGLPVAQGLLIHSPKQAPEVLQTLGGSIVVKPCTEGSSVGVVKLENATEAQIENALAESLRFDDRVVVEERAYGRELTCAVVAGKALPIVEICAPEGNYDYNNKFVTTEQVHFVSPANLDPAVTQSIQRASEKAYEALQCRGWGRVDAIVRPDGSFILLEMNPAPGMTSHSLVPIAARAAGKSFADIVVEILQTAALDHKLSFRRK